MIVETGLTAIFGYKIHESPLNILQSVGNLRTFRVMLNDRKHPESDSLSRVNVRNAREFEQFVSNESEK